MEPSCTSGGAPGVGWGLVSSGYRKLGMGMTNFLAFLEAGINLDNVIRSEIETLSDEELGAIRINFHNQWYVAENEFIQFQNGLMSPEVYEAKKSKSYRSNELL